MRKTVLLTAVVVLVSQVALAQPPGPITIGEELVMTFESPGFDGPRVGQRPELAWRQEITMPWASYVTPHFSRFHLPPGAELTVSAPDGSRSWTYTGHGKQIDGKPMKEFWGIHISGDTAIVEITSTVPIPPKAVVIDKFAHGYPDLSFKHFGMDFEQKALCGADNSLRAQCYLGDPMYEKARAVARLYINGSSACTGWLVGSAGHLLTNEHCIENASTAANTDYEFMAEGTCSQNCESWMACPGTVVANSATLVQVNSTYDFSLVLLPTNPTGTYGYLQMRDSGAVVDERIYIPGYPKAWGKRIAAASTHSQDQSGFCEVYSLCRSGCTGNPCDTGYYCDTQGGSSGSPVLGYSDHCVVSLHHCGTCPNRGVPIEDVIAQLGANRPPNSECGPSCAVDPDCDDGLWCNGAETCNEGFCEAGSSPCQQGEFCNEATDTCEPGCSTDADCDDGLFCNGAETCNAGTCYPGTNPCSGSQICNEATDTCENDENEQ